LFVVHCPSFIVYKEAAMTTSKHCPGFEQFKDLTSFVCKCPGCGKEVEIFSDEFDKNIFAKVVRRRSTLQSVNRGLELPVLHHAKLFLPNPPSSREGEIRVFIVHGGRPS
jgi:hypothetical protein